VQAIVNAASSRGIMGGGVAGVIKRAAGPEVDEEVMIKEIRVFVPRALQTVVLVDVDQAMVQAWREALKDTNRLEKGQR